MRSTTSWDTASSTHPCGTESAVDEVRTTRRSPFSPPCDCRFCLSMSNGAGATGYWLQAGSLRGLGGVHDARVVPEPAVSLSASLSWVRGRGAARLRRVRRERCTRSHLPHWRAPLCGVQCWCLGGVL